jgi:hypothetical protein
MCIRKFLQALFFFLVPHEMFEGHEKSYFCCTHFIVTCWGGDQSHLSWATDSVGDSRAPNLLSFASACVHNQLINQ